MKADITLVSEALVKNELDQPTVAKILKDIEQAAAQAKKEEAAQKEPAVKKQFVIVVPPNQDGADKIGWVIKMPEDDQPSLTPEKALRAAYEYNISKKGRKYPCKTYGETFEAVGGRFMKEQGLQICTKFPVQVIQLEDNKLPSIEE